MISSQCSALAELPSIAIDVSGVIYTTETNPFNTNNIRFVFDPEKDYAELSYTARGNWQVDCQVGLDNVQRITASHGSVFAAVGK